MAVDGGVSPALAIRSSVGIELWASSGCSLPYQHMSNLPREETKSSRSITFSSDGRYFAYSNGLEVKVLRNAGWELQCRLPRPKAFYLKFSPCGNYLCTWELYTITKDKPEGGPNMFVYEIGTGDEMLAIVQKNQTDWEPSWSMDESIFAMVVGGEALFYDFGENKDGFKATARRVGGLRGGVLSLGPGMSPPYLAFYTPGVKGAPSMCKLYKYPALAANQTVACKSFFQADRVELLWNKRGTGLLLLTSTEVDKSGASYYGNQALHFMATKGDSCSVPLSKEGPVHCVKWSPKATEFVVVYGFMPSKAALYNLKCDVVFDFGEGPHNCCYFNGFGNLVVLAGFGNLPGNVEIWDMKKKEIVTNIKCPDTTQFEWNPNGAYFITATTSPRLRIGNGFKVYHYSGALVHETIWSQNQELLAVEWQQFPEHTFTEPIITKAKHESIKSSQPEASKKVYTPPHLRLLKEGKNPENYVPQPQALSLGPSGYYSGQANKNVVGGICTPKTTNQKNKPKNKKKDDGSGIKCLNTNGSNNKSEDITGSEQPKYQLQEQRPPNRKQQLQKKTQLPATVNTVESGCENTTQSQEAVLPSPPQQYQPKKTCNPEKEKKIRNVAKKLSDIKKLKARQDQGETLELNQLNKISMEARFLEELKALKLSV